jgi:hypothetical protein
MKVLAYVVLLGLLGGIAWQYPFLFELPLLGAIGGAYWLFFRQPPQKKSADASGIEQHKT